MNSPRTTLYRDKHNGKLMGVCSGIADYTGVNVFWVRMAAFVSMFVTGGWSIPAYFITGFLLNKAILTRDIPVLLGVNSLNQDAFEDFIGGYAEEINADAISLAAWFSNVQQLAA